jgi:hypothetical protein
VEYIFSCICRVIQLLRLLQIQHPEEIINKLNADNTDQWTLDGKESSP